MTKSYDNLLKELEIASKGCYPVNHHIVEKIKNLLRDNYIKPDCIMEPSSEISGIQLDYKLNNHRIEVEVLDTENILIYVYNKDNSIVYNKIHDFTNENIKNIIEQFR